MLVVISGPGAVGKDHLITRLLPQDPRLRYSVSYTTRPRRELEVDGKHYSFVDHQRFQQLIDAGELLEHATVNGYLYGTSVKRVEEAQASGDDVILKIDVQGAESVRSQRPDGIFIFISPPSMEELRRRREHRNTDPLPVQEQRQKLAEWEMSFADRYDHTVVNEDADRAVEEILALVRSERARRCQ
jgi:guanylate kinase